MRTRAILATIVSCAALLVGNAHAEAPANAPSAEAIFSSAKSAWRNRREAPFVSYNLRERYDWRGRPHENWWQASYRDADRALTLHRIVVMNDERERLKGTPIGLNFKFHKGDVKADSFDTNASADAFPILEPRIEPNASFGLLRREPKMALVGSATSRPGTRLDDSASPLPEPAATATPLVAESASALATEKPLREVARVEAVARDYAIALAGTERMRGTDTYHLALTPLRDPHLYRLRDLWIDRATYATVQLSVQGLFEGKPYNDARWTVAFTPIDGRYYVQQIRTDDPLRFGLDRVVTGLEFDFVAYAFPGAIPDLTFQRLL